MGDSRALAQENGVVKVEPGKRPLSVQAMLGDDSHAESWRRVLEHLATSTATYWLATTTANGTPHVRPVLAVWGGALLLRGRAHAQSSEPRHQDRLRRDCGGGTDRSRRRGKGREGRRSGNATPRCSRLRIH